MKKMHYFEIITFTFDCLGLMMGSTRMADRICRSNC